MTQTALVVGASGIVGSAITQLLIDNQWQVAALSRHPSQAPGVIPVAADLQDPASLEHALRDVKPTHVFITTWSRQATEAGTFASMPPWCATSSPPFAQPKASNT